MKSLAFPAQALLVRIGRWHQLQLLESLRWPAWKSGPTPRVTWQLSHLELSTIARRPVNPVATFETSGGGTIRPPVPAKPLAFSAYGNPGRSISVNGCVLLLNVGAEPRL